MTDNQVDKISFKNRFVSIWKRLYSSLSTNLRFTISLTIFLLVAGGAFVLHSFVVHRVDQVTENSLVGIAAAYEDVLHHGLMVNDVDLVQRMVFDIGNQNQAKAVRLLNRKGAIIASSLPDEVGISLNRSETRCQTCHIGGESHTPLTEYQSFTDSSDDVLLVANPLENRISCQSCHSDKNQSLGVILVEFPRQPYDDWHALFDISLSSSALIFAILLSWVIYSLVSAKVIQPINKLAGEWKLEPTSAGENEIAQISRRLQRMGNALDSKDKELANEHRKIDSLFSIQYNTDHPPSLEQFFRQGLGIIQEITGFSTIALRLYEPKTNSFRLMAQRGMTPEMVEDLNMIPAEAGFHAEIIQTHKPVFTSNIPHDSRVTSSAPASAGFRCLACIPLLAQDVLVGSMQLSTKDDHSWSENDRLWLGLIGRRIGLIIHQIQLSERVRDLAVLEERSRIAQEIHDGLAQLVGALRIWSEEALTCLKDRELDEVQKSLEKIESTARDAYASLREEMLGLRDSIAPKKELSGFLSEYLRRFQRQWGIHAELKLDACAGELDSLPITPEAEIQLLRIIQEGLTNVRRHANASWIIVALSCLDGWLVLRILDDGTGFDMHKVPDDRLGLRIMRERAASAGGDIAITSKVGQGTQLEIKIPLRAYRNTDTGYS